jgi:hypothetical protein
LNISDATLDTAPARPAFAFSDASPAPRDPAKQLLEQTLGAAAGGSLDGVPVTLDKFVRQTGAREQQIAVVKAYWRLSEMLAAYHFARDEAFFFRDLPVPQLGHQRALLSSRQASAEARSATSQLAALQAQQELARMTPLETGDGKPLPADIPFVGAYQTHFKILNDRGAAPDILRPIDQLLPAMRDSVKALAEAVLAADDALTATRQAYEAGQATLRDVLETYEQRRHERREFLSAVRQYNEHIARYALSVSLPGTTTDRVVGMLIETPDTMRSVLATQPRDSGVRRVSNEEDVDDDRWSSPQPGSR